MPRLTMLPSFPPPPPAGLTALTARPAAALLALALATTAQAQTPPNCWSGICTVRLANAGSPVVDGCGDHATPGRMKLILSSTNPNVTRQSFNTNIGFIASENDFGSTFND